MWIWRGHKSTHNHSDAFSLTKASQEACLLSWARHCLGGDWYAPSQGSHTGSNEMLLKSARSVECSRQIKYTASKKPSGLEKCIYGFNKRWSSWTSKQDSTNWQAALVFSLQLPRGFVEKKKKECWRLEIKHFKQWANVLRDQLLFHLLGSFQSAENTVFLRAGAQEIRGRHRLKCFQSNFLSYLITTFKMRYFHLKSGSNLGKKKVFSSLPFLIFPPSFF